MTDDPQRQPPDLASGGNLFLSYRRDDAAADAFMIFDRLNARFPGRVFRDVSTVEPGTDFVDAIEKAMRSSRVLVALIGRQWLSVADASGRRRIDGPRDFVHLEIASALQQNIAVIPVLLRGARMPAADSLPSDISSLSRRQALDITESHFEQDIEHLVGIVERQLGEDSERVRLSGMAGNSGWIVTLDIADVKVKEIRYRLDGQTDFTSTGFEVSRSRDTGLPQPRYQFQLVGLKRSHKVFVKYSTTEGIEHGPYELQFDAERELVRGTKYILDITQPWLSFRHYGGWLLVYFSNLLTYKNAFRRIRYSVDDDSLSRELRFTSDWSGIGLPGINDDDEVYLEIPQTSTYVCVKLYFIDGSESPLTTFHPA